MRHIIKKPEWDSFFYHSSQFDGQVKIENESATDERAKVVYCLDELVRLGFLTNTSYDESKLIALRAALKETFFIFWTAINPPMEHLLYAISAILKPKNILGIGIFTGNPVVWSMGPAIDGSYSFQSLEAVEIDKNNARICQDNFNALIEETTSKATVKVDAEDGFKVLERFADDSIDLLYLDANGFDPATQKDNSKNINYSLLKAAYLKLKSGASAICHNAYQPSFREEAGAFLDLTNDTTFFKQTATVGIDEMGIEWAIKND